MRRVERGLGGGGRWLFLALGLISATVPAVASERTAAPETRVPADFNGDGYADVVFGVSQESIGTLGQAGALNVLYGSAGGLQTDAPADQFWSQDSPGVEDVAEPGDLFGRALGTGDFDGDGYADLVASALFEDLGPKRNAGAVNVLYGSAAGLQTEAPADQIWSQDSPGIADRAEPYDQFGNGVATGDFDGDGFSDLVVGAAYEDVGPASDAGAVNVLYGSAIGLTATGNQFWTQDSPGIEDQAEPGDWFGFSVATGDFNRDGFGDVAAGARREDVGPAGDAGAVNVLYGSAAGLTASGNQFWTQDSPGIEDQAESGDWFGRPLTGGDFDGDGYSDLSVGAPFEDVGASVDAGAVNVLYGSPTGLSVTGNQFWTQDSPDVEDAAEPGDWFGRAVGSRDFDGDGFDDLVVGAHGEDLGTIAGAGAINILYGSGSGISAERNQFWTQDSADVEEDAETNDQFGFSIFTGDIDGDAFADLAIGAVYEDLGAIRSAGGANVLYGTAAGISAARDQFWTQDSPGVEDAAEPTDLFGGGWLEGVS